MSKRTKLTIIALLLLFVVTSAEAGEGRRRRRRRDPNDPNAAVQQVEEVELQVDADRIISYIEWMSRDEMEGRKSLTAGFVKSEEWAAKNFKQWGLEPAGQDGTYFQDVPITRGFTHMTGTPVFRIGNRNFLLEESDFSVHAKSTAATRVEGEVVFAGYGICAPDKGLDEYAGIDVEGKIVLIFKGSPKDTAAPSGSFTPTPSEDEVSDEAWEKESTDNAKIKTAYDKGAAAVLLFDPNPPAEPEPGQRYGYAYGGRPRGGSGEAELEFDRDFLIFTIKDRAFHAAMKPDKQETIAGLNRRIDRVCWEIRKKNACSMATGINARLKGYDSIDEYSEELGNNIARNVLAKIEGTDPTLKNEYIIMGGHMDHLGVRDGFVYNGADDNASGTAVTMEVARVLSEADYKPKRTIIFICWCGEELGLIGSEYYTSNPCDGVTMDQVVTYFNMDMVGLGDTIGAPGALNFPSIWEVIKRNQDEDVIAAVEPSTTGPGGSDYSGFISKGIEALGLMTSGGVGHGDYHKPEDDTEKMDPEILRKTGQFVLQGTMNLDKEAEMNLLIENRQWIYDAMRLSIANINPELEDSTWSSIDLEDYSTDKLRWQIASVEEKPAKRLEVGINNMKLFDGDVELLLAASDALGFGRVDIEGSDGAWIEKGKMTENGLYALGMMEENRIVVNLVSPSPQLLRNVLAQATKPFIVTGFYLLDPQTYDQINKKKVVLGIKFDPANVDGCVEKLEKAKEALGDSDNLILYVTSTARMDEGKKDLYMTLMENGWTKEEIGAGGGGRRYRGPSAGIVGGNLGALRSQPAGNSGMRMPRSR